jgi:hypothetical protein
MTVTIGRFAKSFKTGTSTFDEDCLTSVGNEYPLLKSRPIAAVGIDIAATAANADTIMVPGGMRLKQTRMILRATTAVVDAGSIVPVVKTSGAVTGTASTTFTDTNAIASIGSTNLGTDTLTQANWVFNSDVVTPNTRLVLRHVQGTGGSVAGVLDVSCWFREVKPDVN